MAFFDYFPLMLYDINKTGEYTQVQNLFRRFKFYDIIFSKGVIFYQHSVREGERPDITAYEQYGDPYLDWVVYYCNKIIDPMFEWPLHYDEFYDFLKKKYGSFETAHQTVHHYEYIFQEETYSVVDGVSIPEKVYIVDQDTHNSLSALQRREVSCFDYEWKKNEARRDIKLIDGGYIEQIKNEAKTIVR
jgi:hypothetical protein